MKKSIILGLFVFSLLILPSYKTAYAQVGMMGIDEQAKQTQAESGMKPESVETILKDILKEQNVSTVQKLDVAKVSDTQWEMLGDAVMEIQHPGQAHEIMDQMMGGEGSDSLKQMHINMGKRYLGYGSNSIGMMGYGNRSFGNTVGMMGYGNHSSYFGSYGILAATTWILVIAFLISGIYFFIKNARKK
ncbi:hypothetical protein CO058_01695 [candidate division WWE3 bacterium CG_4_9_14_0_2_um_filter_35_11]|uniref:Uncharacterized protein n=1 Tax=candidate division WWE3 bacterium CG_4_9_14_0_2_um_filter_35_11 TaxID=1975077 RepID=A0A2M8EM10_UNCKA|nr:MAG: hypothetical protein CO058_01695 [candidate division WWE3 bacterium CG_4_9_14_0_2_um_filter_35_11]